MLLFVDFLAFGQEVLWIPFAGRRYGSRVAHHPLFIDNDGRPIGDPLVLQVHAVFFCHLALGMKILQERKGNSAARFRPVVVRESAINAHTHNLGVTGLELVQNGL
jgi:hypothetical protein